MPRQAKQKQTRLEQAVRVATLSAPNNTDPPNPPLMACKLEYNGIQLLQPTGTPLPLPVSSDAITPGRLKVPPGYLR